MSCFSVFTRFLSSRPQHNPTQSELSPPSYSKTPPSAPPGIQSHNASCKVLRGWKEEGEESTNYKFNAWVLPRKYLGEPAYKAQIKCLECCLEFQKIHQFELKVRCIVHNPGRGSQDTNHNVYMDIMAASDITTIAKLWDTSGNAHTEIDEQIGSIIGSSQHLDSEFTNVRDQLYPLLLAKVATSQEGWLVDDFLERKDEILHDDNLFSCLKGPAIVGQFKVQSLSALQAIEKQTPQPLYSLNFVPENVSNAIYNTAKGCFRPVDEALQQKSHGCSKNSRSDFYSLKLVSFGSRSKPQRGNQWQQWDDARSGNTDITDYTYMNAEMFMTRGPGPLFAANLLLAAASPALDRKNLDSGLYGDGADWSFEEQNNCSACHSSARR